MPASEPSGDTNTPVTSNIPSVPGTPIIPSGSNRTSATYVFPPYDTNDSIGSSIKPWGGGATFDMTGASRTAPSSQGASLGVEDCVHGPSLTAVFYPNMLESSKGSGISVYLATSSGSPEF